MWWHLITQPAQKWDKVFCKRWVCKFFCQLDNRTMVFCYQNYSDLLWEKIVLVIEENFEIRGWRPRICKLFEITRTIYSNSERSEQFLVTEWTLPRGFGTFDEKEMMKKKFRQLIFFDISFNNTVLGEILTWFLVLENQDE